MTAVRARVIWDPTKMVKRDRDVVFRNDDVFSTFTANRVTKGNVNKLTLFTRLQMNKPSQREFKNPCIGLSLQSGMIQIYRHGNITKRLKMTISNVLKQLHENRSLLLAREQER